MAEDGKLYFLNVTLYASALECVIQLELGKLVLQSLSLAGGGEPAGRQKSRRSFMAL
jgi:hypothetical protein